MIEINHVSALLGRDDVNAFVINYSKRNNLQLKCRENCWKKVLKTPSIQSLLIHTKRWNPRNTSMQWKKSFLTEMISDLLAEDTNSLVFLQQLGSKYKILHCSSQTTPVEEFFKNNLFNFVILFFNTITKLCRTTLEKQLQSISVYKYNGGPQGIEHTFKLFRQTNNGVSAPMMCFVRNDLIRFRSNHRQFSDDTRCGMVPSPSLKRKRHLLPGETDIHLMFDDSGRKKLAKYYQSINGDKNQFLYQLSCIEDLYRLSCIVMGHKPYREQWMTVFTTVCHNPQSPCTCCRNCRIRISQAAMVVLAAQGVGDSNILPLLGAVFRHPRYQNMSIEQWASLSIAELASIFKKGSKHCLNAYHYHFFIKECMENGPPLQLADIICFRGFSKKSGCLFLKAVLNVDVGIPTDSHVFESAKGLKFK